MHSGNLENTDLDWLLGSVLKVVPYIGRPSPSRPPYQGDVYSLPPAPLTYAQEMPTQATLSIRPRWVEARDNMTDK